MNNHKIQKSIIERSKQLASFPYRLSLQDLRKIDEDAFWDEQLKRFRLIYADALEHVPYYRDQPNIYTQLPLRAPDVLDALSTLPILEKSTVKSDPTQFHRSPRKFVTAEHTTGGTTGTPLKIRASLMERGFTNAILEERNRDLTGDRYPRTIRLSGFLQSEEGSGKIFSQIPGTSFAYLSIYNLDHAHRDQIRTFVERFQPKMFHGYASALHQLSLLFSDEFPLRLQTRPVVISTSETLYNYQRADIERRLHAIVLNEYGSQEGQHFVQECADHQLHIHPARGVVEILDPGKNQLAQIGERGRVVVTGLMNQSMPLIRYNIGDSAVSTGYAVSCECGLAWPTIGGVEGRTEDLVRTRDGRRIGLLAHSTLKDLEGIREAQIIQRGYDDFVFRIALEVGAVKTIIEDHIAQQMYARISSDVVIDFQYVTKVPRTEAGKVRAVVVDFDEPSSGSMNCHEKK